LFAGDAFGAQTEYDKEKDLVVEFPNGILEREAKQRWVGEAGMITDDSEMAIMLATSLIAISDGDGELTHVHSICPEVHQMSRGFAR